MLQIVPAESIMATSSADQHQQHVQVFELALFMEVFDASEQLDKTLSCICLAVGTSFQHCVQQFPSPKHLSDQVDLEQHNPSQEGT